MDSDVLENIDQLREVFERNRDSETAAQMEAYMRNKFKMFGVKTTLRRNLSKSFIEKCKVLPQSYKVDIARRLFYLPEREFDHVAIELLDKGYKRNVKEDDIQWISEFISTNSWWDTVDFIAPRLAGTYFSKFPENRKIWRTNWLESKDIWLIRSAISFQLKYKEKTDLDFLFETILMTCDTNEFFINKAIGWMLRENSRRVPKEIENFVSTYENKLSPLSKKEALRLLKSDSMT